MDVTIGSADDGDAWPPTKDVFVEEKLTWVAAVGQTRSTGDPS